MIDNVRYKGNTIQMKTGKTEKKITSAVADNIPEKRNIEKSSLAYPDNSVGSAALRNMQMASGNSSQAKKIAQLQALADSSSSGNGVIQKKENATGLPDNLKHGVENLSGLSIDDVKVHYNSSEPAKLNAHAFAQGTNIHIAPGQEQHLPHEAWHVVQQKQGRVAPTKQLKGKVGINDDAKLEREASVFGALAMHTSNQYGKAQKITSHIQSNRSTNNVVQRVTNFDVQSHDVKSNGVVSTSGSDKDNLVMKAPDLSAQVKLLVKDGTDLEASKWDLGYIQTIYDYQLDLNYNGHTLRFYFNTPIRDAGNAVPEPWYDPSIGAILNHVYTMVMIDAPQTSDATSNKGEPLKTASRKEEFGAWLIAKNKETEEIRYIGNFEWGFNFKVVVQSLDPFSATVSGTVNRPAFKEGKGAREPKLNGPVANASEKVQEINHPARFRPSQETLDAIGARPFPGRKEPDIDPEKKEQLKKDKDLARRIRGDKV